MFGSLFSIIHFENAIFIGGKAVEKIKERALLVKYSINVRLPVAKAPIEPIAFPKVPTIKSTLSVIPRASVTPRPFFPKTPNA